jgi:hypothetical protein
MTTLGTSYFASSTSDTIVSATTNVNGVVISNYCCAASSTGDGSDDTRVLVDGEVLGSAHRHGWYHASCAGGPVEIPAGKAITCQIGGGEVYMHYTVL